MSPSHAEADPAFAADNPLVRAPGTEAAPGNSERQKYVEKLLQFKHNISPQTLLALLICRGFGNGMSG